MSFLTCEIKEVIKSQIPNLEINKIVGRSVNEVNLIVQREDEVKVLKIMNVNDVKEKKITKFIKNQLMLAECHLSCMLQSKMAAIEVKGKNLMIYERDYYLCDLKSAVYTKCFRLVDICNIVIKLGDILKVLNEYDVCLCNLKSSNIMIEENGDDYDIKICDLSLNSLRQKNEMKIDDICYKSNEELNDLECNEKSAIFSLGCILYEILTHKLPFREENDLNQMISNIIVGEYCFDANANDDKMMKEMLSKMLKRKREDRLSIIEFNKEMLKVDEIVKDSENNLIINVERKEMLNNNDGGFIVSFHPPEYYLESDNYENTRDELIESYNSRPNERVLSILLMMKLFKKDYSIENKLNFQIHHECKKRKEECYLDRMIFDISSYQYDTDTVKILTDTICLCDEGIKYFFRILKIINPKKLQFICINIPLPYQSLFALSFSKFTNLEDMDISRCGLTTPFIGSFIKSIQSMKKLRHVNLSNNPIHSKGFKLLIPYVNLLVNDLKELDLSGMDLDDNSIVLLSKVIHKYPTIEKIDISDNKNIHSKGLKSLISVFPKSNIDFDSDEKKESNSN